ncbi:MAG TPA: GAF domain-containing protein [Herpetosiphonaceae bacterium]
MPPPTRRQYLPLLQRLLAIHAPSLRETLAQASTLIADAFQADKVDCFFHDPAAGMLVALGTSQTPLGLRQQELGLDRLPLVNGGRIAWVFQTGRRHLTGASHRDPIELPEIIRQLGVRSIIAVPIPADDGNDGVLVAAAIREEMYQEADLDLLDATAEWVRLLRQRQEAMQQALDRPATAQLATPEATIAHLTRECARLRAEMLYWQATADELLAELQRRQHAIPHAQWPPAGKQAP